MIRKIMSLFMAIVLVAVLFPAAILADGSFIDVVETEYYATAADALAKLGIIEGYEDNTFGAEKTITRAEMTTIVCRIIGAEDDAKAKVGSTEFKDVSAEHWASGYINEAFVAGIIQGDGNGMFRPEDYVMYEEALKMVVCALGLADKIEVDPNDWAAAYIKIAEDSNLTENLVGVKGEPSKRGDVAVLVYNGLTRNLNAPTASIEGGNYSGIQKVALSTSNNNAVIYYTTDGSVPTTYSKKFTKEITISTTTTLKAIAVIDGVLTSDVMTQKYTISSLGSGSSSNSTYTVSFDLNYDGAENAPLSQKIKKNECVVEPDPPERDNYWFVCWCIDAEHSEIFDFETPITKNIILYAWWINLVDETDNDNDGIPDSLETDYFSTDPLLYDTDADGLSDGMEVGLLGLNPLSKDTDNNGVEDGNEDTDGDSLTNLEEIDLGTSPAFIDTDGDNLSDGIEISVYSTDPLDVDTDSDGVSDGKEVELGTDPLKAQSSFDVSVSSNNNDTVKASVSVELSGDQIDTLSVDAVNDELLFPTTMAGYMGQAYDFEVEGDFDAATISFEFDESMLDGDSEPTIYYFDEEEQTLEELETTINGNIASAKVTHFSKYILIDGPKYMDSFDWEDPETLAWENTLGASSVEIVLVIDDSGSMSSNDPSNSRLSVSRDLISRLPDDSKIGVLKFGRSSTILTGLTTNENEANSYLNTSYFHSNESYTYMFSAISTALGMFSTEQNDSLLKMMVVLTDGNAHDSLGSQISEAVSNNIKIYTVGLGYYDSILETLASETGGQCYTAANAGQLAEIYENISASIDLNTDSDEDGIPDYYEDHITAFNGEKIELNKNCGDTDKDGLKDGEEVEVSIEYNADRTGAIVKGKYLTNPCDKDTDNDGYNDYEEVKVRNTNPLKWNISERDLLICANVSYSDLSVGDKLTGTGKEGADELIGWEVVAVSKNFFGAENKSLIGAQAAAYKIDNNIVIAYRGSEFSTIEKLTTDFIVADFISSVIPYCNAQSIPAQNFARQIFNTYGTGDYNIYFTGHSLGGNLVYNGAAVGLKMNADAVKGIRTFNGLGLTWFNWKDRLDAGEILTANSSKIIDYSVGTSSPGFDYWKRIDPVYNLLYHESINVGLIKHYGEHKTVETVSNWDTHSLSNFYKDSMFEITNSNNKGGRPTANG